MKRPVMIYLLLALHIFLGTGGIAGGALFIMKPDGSLLGMGTEWLDHSPFSNYLLPGIILLIFNGLIPLFTFAGLLLKPDWRWVNFFNVYKNRHWSWTLSLYCGIILITWITVQLIMTQYFWLQPVMIFTGLMIVICTMIPSVMHEYERT